MYRDARIFICRSINLFLSINISSICCYNTSSSSRNARVVFSPYFFQSFRIPTYNTSRTSLSLSLHRSLPEAYLTELQVRSEPMSYKLLIDRPSQSVPRFLSVPSLFGISIQLLHPIISFTFPFYYIHYIRFSLCIETLI